MSKKQIYILISSIAAVIILAAVIVGIIKNSDIGSDDNTTVPETTQAATYPITSGDKAESDSQPQSSEVVSAVSSATQMVDSEAGASSSQGQGNVLVGEWKPIGDAENIDTGEKVPLTDVYGSSYRDYGGTLKFNQNGLFSFWMGAGADDGSHDGSYRLEGDQIGVIFENNTSGNFDYYSDYNGLPAVRIVDRGYYIMFVRRQVE